MATGLTGWINKFFSKRDKDIGRLQPTVDRIKENREQYRDLSDEQLGAKREEFQQRFEAGETSTNCWSKPMAWSGKPAAG